MSLTDTLAQGIAQFEGFNVSGSRAARNNNPGNLRSGPGQIGTDSAGYAIFPDLNTGWAALYNQISLDAGRGLDLQSFIGKYAPPSENNTQNYLNFLVSKLGVSGSTLLSDLGDGSPPSNPSRPVQETAPPGLAPSKPTRAVDC